MVKSLSGEKGSFFYKFCIVASAMLWGITGLFVRSLTGSGLSGFAVAAVRSLFSAGILGIFILITDRKKFIIKLKDLWCFFGTGVVSLLFFNFCYFTGMSESLPVAAAFMYTSPAFILIFSALLFREKITITKATAFLIIAVGCAMAAGLLGSDALITPKGIILGLGSGLGYGLYSIFGRIALDRGYDSMTVTFYTFAFAALGVIPNVAIGNIPADIMFAPKTLLLFVGLAIICTIAPYILYTKGLEGLETGFAGMLSTVELVMTTIVGVFFLGDRMTVDALIGIAFIFDGVIIINFKRKK